MAFLFSRPPPVAFLSLVLSLLIGLSFHREEAFAKKWRTMMWRGAQEKKNLKQMDISYFGRLSTEAQKMGADQDQEYILSLAKNVLLYYDKGSSGLLKKRTDMKIDDFLLTLGALIAHDDQGALSDKRAIDTKTHRENLKKFASLYQALPDSAKSEFFSQITQIHKVIFDPNRAADAKVILDLADKIDKNKASSARAGVLPTLNNLPISRIKGNEDDLAEAINFIGNHRMGMRIWADELHEEGDKILLQRLGLNEKTEFCSRERRYVVYARQYFFNKLKEFMEVYGKHRSWRTYYAEKQIERIVKEALEKAFSEPTQQKQQPTKESENNQLANEDFLDAQQMDFLIDILMDADKKIKALDCQLGGANKHSQEAGGSGGTQEATSQESQDDDKERGKKKDDEKMAFRLFVFTCPTTSEFIFPKIPEDLTADKEKKEELERLRKNGLPYCHAPHTKDI